LGNNYSDLGQNYYWLFGLILRHMKLFSMKEKIIFVL
jgi:hypothetical protein